MYLRISTKCMKFYTRLLRNVCFKQLTGTQQADYHFVLSRIIKVSSAQFLSYQYLFINSKYVLCIKFKV